MVWGIVFVTMVPFWWRNWNRFPGIVQAANMTVAPMAVLCALFLVGETIDPLWR